MKFLVFIQTVFAALLVITVLMHSAKGDGIAAIGGQARVFNAQNELEKGLEKFTTVCAVGFIFLSLIIALIS
jgi:preprotein translocase subunit SecG